MSGFMCLLSRKIGLYRILPRFGPGRRCEDGVRNSGQRREVRSKSTETWLPSGGLTSMVAESEARSWAGNSNWRVAPMSVQPPFSEQM